MWHSHWDFSRSSMLPDMDLTKNWKTNVHISQDVTFDKNFETATPIPVIPFSGALPIQKSRYLNDDSDTEDDYSDEEQTGSPSNLENPSRSPHFEGESEIEIHTENNQDSDDNSEIQT